MKKVILHNRGIERLLAGHPWIYRSQIKSADPSYAPGEVVSVFSERKRFLGVGYVNLQSTITIRILSHCEEEINENFFGKKIQKAIAWRKKYMDLNTTNARRWINSESDGLAGLIVDEYDGYLVIQISTLGMETQRPLFLKALKEAFNPKGIYERNNFPSRQLEGLPLSKGNLEGMTPPDLVEIHENGSKFWIDIVNGHKTGFYLDQRENRIGVAKLAQGKEVLDCFSYTGGFAVSALVHGAKNVLLIESSEEALTLARKNAELNGVQDRWSDIPGNGFDLLKKLSLEERKFDLIVLDPPSFTKKKDAIEQALRGYKEINLRAMKMLREDGILVTASCSHHIQETLFQDIVTEAARDAKRLLTQIHRGTQAIDHPILPAVPETEYLKCLFYQVNEIG